MKRFKYETNKYIYDFQQFETIRSFGDNIYSDKISNLLEDMTKTRKKTRPLILLMV